MVVLPPTRPRNPNRYVEVAKPADPAAAWEVSRALEALGKNAVSEALKHVDELEVKAVLDVTDLTSGTVGRCLVGQDELQRLGKMRRITGRAIPEVCAAVILCAMSVDAFREDVERTLEIRHVYRNISGASDYEEFCRALRDARVLPPRELAIAVTNFLKSHLGHVTSACRTALKRAAERKDLDAIRVMVKNVLEAREEIEKIKEVRKLYCVNRGGEPPRES